MKGKSRGWEGGHYPSSLEKGYRDPETGDSIEFFEGA
jgi:hypothetical protein